MINISITIFTQVFSRDILMWNYNSYPMHNSHTLNITSLLVIDKFFSKGAVPSKRHSLSLQLQKLSPSLLPGSEFTAPDQSCPSSLCVQNLQFQSNWIQLVAGPWVLASRLNHLLFSHLHHCWSSALWLHPAQGPACCQVEPPSCQLFTLLPRYPRLTGRLDVYPLQLPQDSWFEPSNYLGAPVPSW